VLPHPTALAVLLTVLVLTVWGLDKLTRVRIAHAVDEQTYLD
jgi:hypothetical protein